MRQIKGYFGKKVGIKIKEPPVWVVKVIGGMNIRSDAVIDIGFLSQRVSSVSERRQKPAFIMPITIDSVWKSNKKDKYVNKQCINDSREVF